MASDTGPQINVVVDFLYAMSLILSFVWAMAEFSSGGLESLFSNQKQIKLAVPAKNLIGEPANMDYLIKHLSQHHLKGRKDFFLLDDAV